MVGARIVYKQTNVQRRQLEWTDANTNVKDLASQYEISSMPTFILLKSGKKIDSMTGANDAKLKGMIIANK